MIGLQIGKWKVLEEGRRNKWQSLYYVCRCECGTVKEVLGSSLKSGGSSQCSKCGHSSQRRKLKSTTEEILKAGELPNGWKIIRELEKSSSGVRRFECKCICGEFKTIYYPTLTNPRTSKCKKCAIKTHGRSHSPTYNSWESMIQRCNNPKNKKYNDYGGRGIKVAERWLKFDNFLADMGERTLGMQLDRIDNDGNYEPGNCRWVTPIENLNNKTRRLPSTIVSLAGKMVYRGKEAHFFYDKDSKILKGVIDGEVKFQEKNIKELERRFKEYCALL